MASHMQTELGVANIGVLLFCQVRPWFHRADDCYNTNKIHIELDEFYDLIDTDAAVQLLLHW